MEHFIADNNEGGGRNGNTLNCARSQPHKAAVQVLIHRINIVESQPGRSHTELRSLLTGLGRMDSSCDAYEIRPEIVHYANCPFNVDKLRVN